MSKQPECIKCGDYISHGNIVCQDCLPEHDADIARKAREDLLNRLDKEIATRENEMNRKGNLEDNLTTATGYLTAAGALNWVRVVLIDGSRDTIDGDALRTTPPQSGQEQPR